MKYHVTNLFAMNFSVVPLTNNSVSDIINEDPANLSIQYYFEAKLSCNNLSGAKEGRLSNKLFFRSELFTSEKF